MAAGTLNLTGETGLAIEGHATYRLFLTLIDQGGDPIDLTNYTTGASAGGFRWQMRRDTFDADPPLFDAQDGTAWPGTGTEVLTPDTAGQVVISLSYTDTDAAQDTMTAAEQSAGLIEGVHDLIGIGDSTAAGGTVYRWKAVRGDAHLQPTVTRF